MSSLPWEGPSAALTGLVALQAATTQALAAEGKQGRISPVAALMQDQAALANLRAAFAETPAAVEAELARLGSVVGVSALAKTLRGLIKTPLRVVQEEPEAADDQPITLRFALDRDDVPDLILPQTWEISPSGLWRVRQVGEDTVTERVSHEPIFITQRFSDLDTDAMSLALTWTLPGGRLREAIVPRAQVFDARELVKLAGIGAPVNSAVSSMLVRWLADLEGINRNLLPSGWASTRCGWLGKQMRYYLCGADLLCAGEPLHDVRLLAQEGGAQLLGYLRTEGTFEGWCQTVSKITAFPLAMLGIYGACSAPLLRILLCDNYIIDWACRAGRGKTTALRLGMSCFGVPEEGRGLIRSWSATATGAERVAFALSDMPMALDDSAKIPDRDKPKVASTLYMIANGSGKTRGTRTGLDHVASWHTVCLSSSEASVTTFTQDEGVQARVISVHGYPLGENGGALAEEIRSDLTHHYGHVGPRLVRWLLDHRERWEMLREVSRERIEYWRAKADNQMAGRCAKYIAAMEITADILHTELGVPRSDTDVFAELWGRTQSVTADADKAAAAVASTYAWAVANRVGFWSPHGAPRQPVTGWLGRWDRIATELPAAKDAPWSSEPDDPERVTWGDDEEHLYILPDVLNRLLSTLGYQPQAMIAEWKERGWLRIGGKGTTWRALIGGSPRQIPLVGLRLKVLPSDG
jgi:hypothetical protein